MMECFDSRADLRIEPQQRRTATTLEGHHGT